MDQASGSMTEGSSARREAPAQPRIVPEKVAAPELVRPRSASELVRIAVDRWREALVQMSGGSPLRDIDLLDDAKLDLAGVHPSGVAQLFTGRPTRLSNIFRDTATLPSARRHLRLVLERAKEQSEKFGIAPMYLVIGVAHWTERHPAKADFEDLSALMRVTDTAGAADAGDDRESQPVAVRAPVLLRPISIKPRGKDQADFELTLEPTIEINPVVARALRARGALLDPQSLAQATFDSEGFDPGAALDRIDALGRAVFEDFTLSERRLIGTFTQPGQALVDDLDELVGLEHHELIAALAGHAPSLASLAVELPAFDGRDVDPNLERGVGDLDPSGRRVLEALATGGHIFVDAPLGTDTTGLVAAVVAEASAIGRSVMYVPGHRRAAASLKVRLHELDLEELVLDVPPDQNWRARVSQRLLGAMTHDADPVDVQRVSKVRRELTTVRTELTRTMESLHAPRPEWGVSAYEALQALVGLSSATDGPRTRVRLDALAARSLSTADRQELARRIIQLGADGGLSADATASPWSSAHFAGQNDADRALVRVERLLDDLLVAVGDDIATITEELQVAAPMTLGQWREQVTVLMDLRALMNDFVPAAFERSAQELIAATATKAWRSEQGISMSWSQRRRLLKHANDLVRPGTHVADLHAELINVEEQRQRWHRAFPDGGWPRVPNGIARANEHLQLASEDVAVLDELLGRRGADSFFELELSQMASSLAELRIPVDTLHKIQEHAEVLEMLDRSGVKALVEDVARRGVALDLIADELELAWWTTAFNDILANDPYLSQIDGARIETLAARFRALDAEHLRLLVPPIKAAAAGHIHDVLGEHAELSDELFAELVDERLASMRDALERYGDVVRRLRPVLIATPTLVPQLTPPHRTVDLVIIDAAQHLSVETTLSAVARGRQVMVVGDRRSASGTAVGALGEVLTSVSLSGDWVPRDPNLTQFLIDHGYGDVLRPIPLPQAEKLVSLCVVDGRGMHNEETGLVESTKAEIEKVIELAIDQAVSRPDESLLIVTSTPLHAARIRAELLAQVRRHPALLMFFDPRRAEPVVITDLVGASGVTRDAVIFAVGFGRTPHGRVLHRFGPMSERGGEALLLSMLGDVRHRLSIVSSFGAHDLDPSRLKAPGAKLLGDLLEFAHDYVSSDQEVVVADQAEQPNQLVIDLAARLWNSGLLVETGYGLPGGDKIPLAVAHPDFPGEFLVAVLTDDDAYVAEPSVRVRDRQRAARLERLGWTVMQVWSVSLFLDPERQANRIRQAVLSIAQRRHESDAPVTGALPTLLDQRSAQWVEDIIAADGQAEQALATTETGALPIVAASIEDEARPTAARELPDYARSLDEGAGSAQAGASEPESGAQVSAVSTTASGILAPNIRRGLPVSAYTDDELDDLVRWLGLDGAVRTLEQWLTELRRELGITKRSVRVDASLTAAVRRVVTDLPQ
ncbi:hypothetical protein [Rarobacter incanus]|uniref:Restriction endonuclease type II-like domain-containing protein n=1 Tax=Rarobacter incanus TaxID=153494 RepID=A0A542SNU9_9MICO|nr:hypothetical protein [Rarobacter incanus]TQK76314.1 hypothetical protein FB389_0980 [Rarobacter incanus]